MFKVTSKKCGIMWGWFKPKGSLHAHPLPTWFIDSSERLIKEPKMILRWHQAKNVSSPFIIIFFKKRARSCVRWSAQRCQVLEPGAIPVWRWPRAHSSSPAAGWPCSAGCCSRRWWVRGRALWWGVGGWSTGTAADTVSAAHWAAGQTARSPGTHREKACAHTSSKRHIQQ